MKAAVYTGNGMIEIRSIPRPRIGADEILLRVRMVGLCKTDVKKIVHNIYEPPRVFGHEIVGEVAAAGRRVRGWRAGERALVFHHVPCLDCFYCRHRNYSQCETYRAIDTTAGFGKPSGGGFAEYVRVPDLVVRRGLVRVPDRVPDEAAVFVEPLNCCLKAVKKADLSEKSTVLIVGQGSIGLTLTQLCRLHGPRIIATDLCGFKLSLARRLGAHFTVRTNDPRFAQKIRRFNGGHLPDRCLVAVEAMEAVEQAMRTTAGGGRIVFVPDKVQAKSLLIEPDLIFNKEVDLIGSYSSDYSLQKESADLVFKGRFNTKAMVTHVVDLDQLPRAVRMAVEATRSIKILIRV
jgi:L-iditol 2-dehydrogenase